jgi:hypothetical protein
MSEEAKRKRRYPRYDVTYPITVRLPSGGVAKVKAQNASIGGLCLKGIPSWQADVGDTLTLEIDLEQFCLRLVLEASIIWRDPDSKLIGLAFQMGEENLSQRVADLIVLLQAAITPDQS